jgi:hypothetical protein
MASREIPSPGGLVVRPVVEEFKAHAQERIGELERSKKVEALKVYLDAAELGVHVLLEAQMESAEESAPAGAGILTAAGREPSEAEEEPGVETEDLVDAEDSETRSRPGRWNLPRGEDVLVGEESAAEAGPPGEEPEGGSAPGTAGGEKRALDRTRDGGKKGSEPEA